MYFRILYIKLIVVRSILLEDMLKSLIDMLYHFLLNFKHLYVGKDFFILQIKTIKVNEYTHFP